MGSPKAKPNSVRYYFLRILSIVVIFVFLRFAYIGSRPEFFRLSGTRSSSLIGDENDAILGKKIIGFYSSRFPDLIFQGYLSLNSKALCIGTPGGEDVLALKKIGVNDSMGISRTPLRVIRKNFGNSTFDFVFSGNSGLDRSLRPYEYASEMGRVLKPHGVVVVHTNSARDLYSLNSLLRLFDCCKLVHSQTIDYLGFRVEEIVLKKKVEVLGHGKDKNKCFVPAYKRELVQNAEPLIKEEPLKPWITLKRSVKNVKYLPSIVDISFKEKYVYIDVGARSYGSSIGSWFKKQYPKQNKTFEIYAIEADKAFHAEYTKKKNVKLLPYAAWLRNETLFFEINRDPVLKNGAKRRGMGRVQTVQSAFDFMGDVDKIHGFDFANWLKNTVSEKDFIVMKMDVEGTEFDLIPKLFETGAICLIDEIFLECHYNRWQKCCPGKRSPKYQKTYAQCLELFSSLRKSGVLVHQWW